ncbi:alcohol dehydrogenase catalytic domain-containing protein [Bacterioplanoides sp.]|uniref:alcohol dehydrogenase catalytic domain-containing protein n=1 Tax=Bacterioplanoides sp. TaxID=2066072 RepID=UPI003AFFC20F
MTIKPVPAWLVKQTGTPDVLVKGDIELAEPQTGEVKIRVCAAGFNPIDTKIRAGLAPILNDAGVLGCDVSGEVIAIGDGVTHLAVGDCVYGCAGGVKGNGGALAAEMVCDADLLAKAPQSVSLVQAASIPLVAITAFEALKRLAPQAHEKLLVMGASGGVGQWAIRLAQESGIEVFGTAGSNERVEQLKQQGVYADLHANAAELSGSWEQPGFEKVLDAFGGESLQKALEVAAPYAQVATINARNNYDLTQAHAKSLTLHAIFMLLPLLTEKAGTGKGRKTYGEFLAQLSEKIDAGFITVPVAQEQQMSDVAEIHRTYEAGELSNKVVMIADF